MTDYNLGETAIIEVEIKKSGSYIDPSTVKISIKLPDKTVTVNESVMTNDSQGHYHYDYLLPAETTGQIGTYTYKVTGTSVAGNVKIADGSFEGIKSF